MIVNLEFHVTTGYQEFQRDPSVLAAMQGVLDRVKANAGEGFETDIEPRSGRRKVPRGSVRTVTYAARRRQAAEHVLEQSLDI